MGHRAFGLRARGSSTGGSGGCCGGGIHGLGAVRYFVAGRVETQVEQCGSPE